MVYSYCAGEDGYFMFTRSFHPFSPPAVVGVQVSRAHITVGKPNRFALFPPFHGPLHASPLYRVGRPNCHPLARSEWELMGVYPYTYHYEQPRHSHCHCGAGCSSFVPLVKPYTPPHSGSGSAGAPAAGANGPH
eukprot:5268568-Pyramimonas_sp.AAC.1